MEIYIAEGKKLEKRLLSILDRHLGTNHHNYQDNFCKSMKLAKTLLDKKIWDCGSIKVDWGIPHDIEEDAKNFKKRAVIVPEKR
jgi:hypothetical protein